MVVVGPGAMAGPIRSYTDLGILVHVPRETVFLSDLKNLGDQWRAHHLGALQT